MAFLDSSDPFAPAPAVNPNPGPDERNGLMAQWQNWMQQPGNRAAMVQFGLNMMQPVGIGQTLAGHTAQAIGAGGEAAGRVEESELAERKVQAAETTAESRLEGVRQRAESAAARLGLAGERVGLARERLQFEREKEGGRQKRFEVSNETRLEIARMSDATRRELTEFLESGRDIRQGLSLSSREEVARLSREARKELFDVAEEGRESRFGRGLTQREREEEGRLGRAARREEGRGIRDIFRTERGEAASFTREMNRQAVELYKKANDILVPENDPVKQKYKGKTSAQIAAELANDPAVRQRWESVRRPTGGTAAPTTTEPAVEPTTEEPAAAPVADPNASLIAAAKAALAKNAPREEVLRRLRLRGIDPSKYGL